jgi:diguanylate cyclase (GGDEF)-like protein
MINLQDNGQNNIQDKIELLKKVDIFSSLKNKELSVVASYSHYYNFKTGDLIFTEGSQREELCIIKEGEVRISKSSENNDGVELARFITSEFFGELDLLDNTPRTADAVAEKETTILIFPRKEVLFHDILQEHPGISALILHKLLAIIAGRIRTVNSHISDNTPWIIELRKHLLKDKLTGLYNRTFLDEDFKTLLKEHEANNTSLILVKPDNFKHINDTYGHDTGDKVLKTIAGVIMSAIRKKDIAARYRGDEFAVILPDTGSKTASIVAERIRSMTFEMDLSTSINNPDFKITASIGITSYPEHADNAETLMEKTAQIMLEARKNGGDRILCAP